MKNKNIKLFTVYTMIFIGIIAVVFIPFYSNGRTLILNDDGSRQHYIIFCDYISNLKSFLFSGENFNTFRWSIGLGENVVAQYSYYIVGDLFAYIGLLFPESSYPFAYSFLIILRIFFVGISMLCFCSYKKVSFYKSLLSAIVYTFSSFIFFASVRHPYFTNAMILFPLIMIGVEKLVIENKKVFLTTILFFSLLFNFYFSYIMFIMGSLYAVLLYLFESKERSIKSFLILLFKAFICFVISFCMASVIVVPAIYTFFNMTTLNRNHLNGLYPIQYYFDLIRSFTIVKSYDFWVQIGVSSLVIILIPLIFKNFNKYKKESILLIIMFIMLLFPFFGSIMNGFSFPSNRWIFVFTFFLAWVIPCVLKENLIFSKSELVLMCISTLLYFTLYSNFNDNKFEWLFEFLFALFIMIIFTFQYKFKTKKISQIALVLVVALNCSFNGLYYYSVHGYNYAGKFLKFKELNSVYKDSNGEIKNFDKIIKTIKMYDDGFYRIGKFPNSYGNLSITYNYNSFDSYLSLLNGNQVNYSNDLNNINRRTSNNIGNFDNRTIATNILGGKYFIVNRKDLNKVPYGYDEYMTFNDGETIVLKNKYYLSPIIFYDNYILEEDYDKLSPLEKEESNLLGVSINENKILENESMKSDMPTFDNIKKLSCTIKESNKTNSYFKLECPGVENSILFVNISNLDIIKSNGSKFNYNVTVSKDNIKNIKKIPDKKTSAYYFDMPELLFNLGYVESSYENNIQIRISPKNDYKISNIDVYAVLMNDYEENIKKMNENKFEILNWKDGYIKGKIKNDHDGILQLSTNYSKGWKVIVDGKETEPFITNKAFLGISLSSGEHVIEYEYTQPFQKASIITTIAGFISFAPLIFYEKNKR